MKRLLLVALLLGSASTYANELVSEADIAELVARMTLDQKVGQLNLWGRGSRGSYDAIPAEQVEAVRAGRVGALINIMDVEEVDRIQRVAVEESPHGIPLMFGRDVIHGLHALSPIPLAQIATWHPELVEAGARMAAIDASAYGIRWTFAPMLDITRDPRWGRIAESVGEDPFLAARMAEAMVHGFQGKSLGDPTSIAACAKHFAAYGAAEGGRDYNTVSLPETELRNIYLPPFEAAVQAGAASMMSAFNELNGIPTSAHPGLLSEVLRREWRFDGFVVSDWGSITEMVTHGFSTDARAAARQAAIAGLDMDMMSRAYAEHLVGLVSAGEIPESVIDTAVKNILRIKYRLGLFDEPYRTANAKPGQLNDRSLAVARELALESAVLLRNEGQVLPIAEQVGRIAVIGPLADAPREQLGTWAFDGRSEDTVTPLAELRQRLGPQRIEFAPGLEHSRSTSRAGFSTALQAASAADVVLFFGGEEAILSGEAHSRAILDLPGAQPELIHELAAIGKPIVLVILAGRPLTIHSLLEEVDAVLMAWHPGTMGGPAIADLLFGVASPSGRLPVTWPKAVGQIPLYYNHKSTGRPPNPDELIALEDIPVGAWQSSLANTSHYLDLGMHPEFPFGFGLTYASFEYSDLEVKPEQMTSRQPIVVSATISNTGSRRAAEVVQLYVRDLVGSRTRPVRELKGFVRVELDPGVTQRVQFEIAEEDLGFFDGERWTTEPGGFQVWIAPDAVSGVEGSFTFEKLAQ